MLEKTHGNFLGHKSVILGEKQTALKFRTFCKEDNVEKVLALELSPVLSSMRIADGVVEFDGKVTAKILVEEQNGSVGGMSYTADISDSFANASITRDSILTTNFTIVEASTETVGAEITVNAIVNTQFVFFEEVKKEFLEQTNIHNKRRDVLLGQVVEKVAEEFLVDTEMEINDDIARVLATQSNVIIESTAFQQDRLVVSGEILLNLVYLPTNQNHPKSLLLPFDFSQEIDCKEQGVALLRGEAKSTKIHLEVLEDQKTSVFSVEVSVAINGVVIAQKTQDSIVDCFSVTNTLDLQSATVETTLAKGAYCIKENIKENLSEEWLQDQSFCGVFGSKVDVLSATAQENAVVVTGVLYCNLLFAGEKLNVFNAQIPFEKTIEIDCAMGDKVECFAVLCDLSVEDSLAIDAKIAFCVNILKTTYATFICDAIEGVASEKDFGAIEVCLAFKGEQLWNIAKGLSMSVEDILKLNPQLSDPLEEDTKLLVYHQLQA